VDSNRCDRSLRTEDIISATGKHHRGDAALWRSGEDGKGGGGTWTIESFHALPSAESLSLSLGGAISPSRAGEEEAVESIEPAGGNLLTKSCGDIAAN
jgi:hypothetical protein